jgi:hypothetical protein
MTSIPGTNYQVRDNNFVAKDGTELSAQQFVDKVKNKEISLTENSLQMLSNHLGLDLMQSLRQSSAPMSTPQKVGDALRGSDKAMGDVIDVLMVVNKATQGMRKGVSESRQAQFSLQIGKQQEANDKFMAAAWVRFGTGMASAAATAVQGGITLAHTGAGLPKAEAKVEVLRGEAFKTFAEAANKVLSTGGEFWAANIDKESKDADTAAQTIAQQVKQSEELLDSIKELESKVREAFSRNTEATGRSFTV